MKAIVVFVFSIVASINLYAQNDSLIESMMTKRAVYCPDVIMNATALLPQLHQNGERQTIVDLLNYWNKKCGMTEPLYAFKTLYDIEHNEFKEDFSLYYFLNGYKRAVLKDSLRTYELVNREYVDSTYYPFIKQWSERLFKATVKYNDVEKFVLQFYANPSDSLMETVKGDDFDKTDLQRGYKRQRHLEARPNVIDVSISSGVWLPIGELSKIGAKGFIGFQMGYVNDKIRLFADMQVRFGRTRQHIYTYEDDSLYQTRKHTGVYLGLGGEYRLLQKNQHSIHALMGVGYDGLSFILVEGKGENKDYTKSIPSVNINGGIGYRFSSDNWTLFTPIGIDAKYHYLHYRNSGGTNLTGNSITIGLSLGLNMY